MKMKVVKVGKQSKPSSTGVLDWNTSSYTDDIAGSETKFNEDLNNDGAIGIDTSNLTLKTTDNLALN